MKRFACSAIILAGAALFCAPSLADTSRNQTPVFAPDVYGGYPTTHVIVRFVPGTLMATPASRSAEPIWFAEPALDAALNNFGVTSITPVIEFPIGNPELAAQIGLDRYFKVNVPQGSDVRALLHALREYPQFFEHVELDGIGGTADTIPNDPAFNQLYGMHNTGQNATCPGSGLNDADIDAPGAWDIWTGVNNITLAVIDSGVQPHVDFTGRLMTGWNTVTNNTEVSDASCPHGTHCAGTATATGNNGVGVAGVHWAANILPVKVLTGCSGNETDCGEGIVWAADNGANVGTMSLQYYTGTQFFNDSVQYGHQSGMVLIAATGNNQGNNVAFPAKFPNCMGVGATTNVDTIASFSNFGPQVDVSAPGQNVWSTLNVSGYDCYSGTSMATPHVSGLACLLWSYNPGLSNDQVIAALIDNVDDLGAAGWDQFFGHGRVNAARTLQNNSPGLNIAPIGPMPGLVAPGNSASFTVRVSPGPDTLIAGSETLHYRYNGGTYITTPLVHDSGEFYTANLPTMNCGDTPEFYVSAASVESGVKTAPFNAPTTVYSASVGELETNVVYTQGFASGQPAGWTRTGLWNFGTNCSVGASCEGGGYAFYANPSTCNYDTGSTTVGDLTSTAIAIPAIPPGGSATLKFCYTLQTENLSPYDAAIVFVNNVEIGRASESPSSWTNASFDMTAFGGQNATLRFRFDSVDSLYNTFRGWQIDGIVIEVTTVTCDSACPGDVNGDGNTCQDDLAALLAAYNTAPGDPGYNANAGNLAPPSSVGQEDLAVLLANYGCGTCQ